MSTYAIGDIHGCLTDFERLLERIDFVAGRDRLWLVGDIVNGGGQSLGVLRWVHAHADDVEVVLGNHDLHMLAVASGVRERRGKDDFADVLRAPDGPELLRWLRHQKLVHREGDWLMVHAGLLPQWTPEQAESLAREIEAVLRSDEHPAFFEAMYGNEPRSWRDDLAGFDRLRIGVNAMTRMRVLNKRGELSFKFKGELCDVPKKFRAWFDVPERKSAHVTVVCGHWSALGLQLRPDLAALDTGCVWGRALTALRLEDRALFQVDCGAV